MALCPVVDINRDPRWGRTDETLGEDPYLNGTLSAAIVRGLQGTSTGEIAPHHVAATLKHLTGHGQPEGGLNRSPGDVTLRELYDSHLVPFRIAIAGAQPAAVMPSYNEVNGVPSHTNQWLLQDVLRGELGFKGLVVSDYSGIEYLVSAHEVAADLDDAARQSITRGVDINLPDGRAFANLKQLVENGKVPLAVVDAAVRRMLQLKLALNLWEDPYGDADQSIALPKEDSSQTLARKAAQESIVLLKNTNHLLPITKQNTLAVIGPNANEARLGSYSGDPPYKVTVLDGIKSKMGDNTKVLYSEGCKIISNLPDSSYKAWHDLSTPTFPTDAENKAAIADAVETARKADVIILVLGEVEPLSRESWAANHLGDRASLDLPGAQNDLADAIFSIGKPVIVYLMNGRPLGIPKIVDKADAVIEGWYMGQETGNAAADILFGDTNPSGKLTISVPRSVGQIPVYYDHKPGARLFPYADETTEPLFPFGFGLSYTTFDYSTPTLSSPTMKNDGAATVSATITNTGAIAGDEIVQFYIHQKVSSVTRPVKELRGFQRIHLAPGEKQTVTFPINRQTLAFHDLQMNYTVEPGDFEMMIGPSSAQVQKVTLHVTE
jgi:beta-glucosidase